MSSLVKSLCLLHINLRSKKFPFPNMDAKTSMHEPIVALEFGGIIGSKSKMTHVLAKKKETESIQSARKKKNL